MIHQNLGNDLHQLEVETFEIEDINDLGVDAPALIGDDVNAEIVFGSCCSCSCSSCCSCSCSSCCSCSCSCSSCS